MLVNHKSAQKKKKTETNKKKLKGITTNSFAGTKRKRLAVTDIPTVFRCSPLSNYYCMFIK